MKKEINQPADMKNEIVAKKSLAFDSNIFCPFKLTA